MGIPGFTASAVGENDQDRSGDTGEVAAHRISVPGLISTEIGLGDVIARIASGVGIQPCGGCRRRAQALNSWVSFTPRR